MTECSERIREKNPHGDTLRGENRLSVLIEIHAIIRLDGQATTIAKSEAGLERAIETLALVGIGSTDQASISLSCRRQLRRKVDRGAEQGAR